MSASLSDEWEMDPNHLFMKEKLGEGNFGEVYHATIADEVDCIKAKKYVEDMAKVSKTPYACAVAVKLLKGESWWSEQEVMMIVQCDEVIAQGQSILLQVGV